MDFGSGIVSSVSKTRDGLRNATIKYENDKFFAVLSNGKELNVNAYDFNNSKVKYLYSKPANNKHIAWTKIKNRKLNNESFGIISKYWSTVKPNLKVKGVVYDNYFIIKKY